MPRGALTTWTHPALYPRSYVLKVANFNKVLKTSLCHRFLEWSLNIIDIHGTHGLMIILTKLLSILWILQSFYFYLQSQRNMSNQIIQLNLNVYSVLNVNNWSQLIEQCAGFYHYSIYLNRKIRQKTHRTIDLKFVGKYVQFVLCLIATIPHCAVTE